MLMGKCEDTHCNPPVLRPLPLLHHLRRWRSKAHLQGPRAGLYPWELVVGLVGT